MRPQIKRGLNVLTEEIVSTFCKLILLVAVGCFFSFGATLGFFFALPFVTRLL